MSPTQLPSPVSDVIGITLDAQQDAGTTTSSSIITTTTTDPNDNDDDDSCSWSTDDSASTAESSHFTSANASDDDDNNKDGDGSPIDPPLDGSTCAITTTTPGGDDDKAAGSTPYQQIVAEVERRLQIEFDKKLQKMQEKFAISVQQLKEKQAELIRHMKSCRASLNQERASLRSNQRHLEQDVEVLKRRSNAIAQSRLVNKLDICGVAKQPDRTDWETVRYLIQMVEAKIADSDITEVTRCRSIRGRDLLLVSFKDEVVRDEVIKCKRVFGRMQAEAVSLVAGGGGGAGKVIFFNARLTLHNRRVLWLATQLRHYGYEKVYQTGKGRIYVRKTYNDKAIPIFNVGDIDRLINQQVSKGSVV